MQWVPEAQAIVILCTEYGYTPDEVGQLTESQFSLLIAGLRWRRSLNEQPS
jgi:hypothetical protein